MQISKEHKISFYLSFSLLIIAVFLSSIFHKIQLWIHFENYIRWQNKYYIFIFLAFFIYIFSYYLISRYAKNIKEANNKLKNYNHHLAHEIKTPLSVIQSNLELLNIDYDKDLVYSSLSEINILKDIVDNLLFLSENNTKIQKEKLCLSDFLDKYNDLEIIDKNDFCFIWNKSLIDRFISNIIWNAYKYKKTNSKIKVVLDKNICVFENQIDKMPNIENTKILFDSFYRLRENIDKDWYWLWLSIVKKISDLHNFYIKIDIKNNTFSFILKK